MNFRPSHLKAPSPDGILLDRIEAFLNRCEDASSCGAITQADIEAAEALARQAEERSKALGPDGRWGYHPITGPHFLGTPAALLMPLLAFFALQMTAPALLLSLSHQAPNVTQAAVVVAGALLWLALVWLARGDAKTRHDSQAIDILAGRASELREQLRLLSESVGSCREAVEIVKQSLGAAALQQQVLARGEPLRRFHLAAFRTLLMQERCLDEIERHADSCRALHGLGPVTA